jgi:hypothetical protein
MCVRDQGIRDSPAPENMPHSRAPMNALALSLHLSHVHYIFLMSTRAPHPRGVAVTTTHALQKPSSRLRPRAALRQGWVFWIRRGWCWSTSHCFTRLNVSGRRPSVAVERIGLPWCGTVPLDLEQCLGRWGSLPWEDSREVFLYWDQVPFGVRFMLSAEGFCFRKKRSSCRHFCFWKILEAMDWVAQFLGHERFHGRV